MSIRRCLLAAVILAGVTSVNPAGAEAIKLLIPGPLSIPAFAPFVVAKQSGYYAIAELEVSFIVGRGGVDVAKQVGVGNADLGDALGDTPILVRANGVPVKAVAVLGGGALTVVVARGDRGITSLKDMKGKKISVFSYEDTGYYSVVGALAAVGVVKSEVTFEAVGPSATPNLVIAGATDACACIPDWEVTVRNALPDAVSLPTVDYFPSMAQAIIASDEVIAKRPAMIAGFVKATLQGMGDTMVDPAKAAQLYTKEVPSLAGQETLLTQDFKAYDQRTYYGQPKLGLIDRERMAIVQQHYLDSKQIRNATPVDQLYTNAFAGTIDAPIMPKP